MNATAPHALLSAADADATALDHPSQPQLQACLQAQRSAFAAQPCPSASERQDKLRRLRAVLLKHQDALAQAMSDDFGGRSVSESKLMDVMGCILHIDHAIGQVRRWMKPQRRHTELLFLGNSAWVEYQPKGVVGIIVPWNFPVYLAVGPLVAALVAGNRAMLKMSELTPHTTRALRTALAEAFAQDEVCVLGGEVEVGQRFASLPFDHLIFTGSTRVGRQVMQAAAEHLVPVTLELGGKSPVVVSRSADIASAAAKITHGKAMNCGQICIAPDYAFVPREQLQAFVQAVQSSFNSMYPDSAVRDSNYTCVVSDRHAQRIHTLLDEARQMGAQVVPCQPGAEGRRIPLHLVIGVTPEMKLAHEEIFGPVLLVVPYDTIDDVIAHINARPRPLALYYFGSDTRESARLRRDTHAGGMTLNDWGWHVLQSDLPFGGVGDSGMGSYHGIEGFRTLSHGKSVFNERRWFPSSLFHPPYGNLVQRLVMRFYLGPQSHKTTGH